MNKNILRRIENGILLFIAFTLLAYIFSACSGNQPGGPALTEEPAALAGAPVTATPIADQPVILPASEKRLEDPRPNIIVIMTDDQPYTTIKYMPTVRDKLMAQGVYFENGFVTTPLCCPSRVSILTGQYVHHHHVYTNRAPNGGATVFDDSSTCAVWLKENGYSTGYVGKYLNEYAELQPKGRVPSGWDEWAVLTDKTVKYQFYLDYTMSVNGQIMSYPARKENFSADVITYDALKFINEMRDKPFMLYIGYYNPHSPHLSAPRHKDTFRRDSGITVPRTPSFIEADISDKPAYLQTIQTFGPEGYDSIYLKILRSLLSVDEGVAAILDTLQKTGLTEKTVIVYLSDNGLSVGEHRILGKNCPYEECVRIPFIVYAPGMFAPRTETRFVANIDLAPTFAELAGVPIPASVDGTSMVPMLLNPSAAWRDKLLLEHWQTEAGGDDGDAGPTPGFFAIRAKEWKYVEYDTGEYELYDLQTDPYEVNNLARLPEYKGTMAKLSEQLKELKSR